MSAAHKTEHPLWYAVMTGPRMEDEANANLRQQGYMTFYPFIRVRRRWKVANRKQYKVGWFNVPYFPRYLFVAIRRPGDSLYDVNETDGIATVVHLGGDPLPIPHDVMDELMGRADLEGKADEIDMLARKRFAAGAQVRLADDSPLAGLLAQVVVDSGRAVTIWLEMLGKQREVSVPPELLQAANS